MITKLPALAASLAQAIAMLQNPVVPPRHNVILVGEGGIGVVSAEAGHVAFSSQLDGLTSDDQDGEKDIFLAELGGTVRLVSHTPESSKRRFGQDVAISANGQWTLYTESEEPGPAGTLTQTRLIIYDGSTGEARPLDLGPKCLLLESPVISGDGTLIAFIGILDAEGAGAVKGRQAYCWNRTTGGTPKCLSRRASDEAGVASDLDVALNGRYVVFSSNHPHLVSNDGDEWSDVFIFDLESGDISLVSECAPDQESTGDSGQPSVSADGRFVAFCSRNSGILPRRARSGVQSVYVKDLETGTTRMASVSLKAERAAGGDCMFARISANGRFVAFSAQSDDLCLGDSNGQWDVFRRDLHSGGTVLVSVSSEGIQGRRRSMGPVSISGDGQTILFSSFSDGLVSGVKLRSRGLFLWESGQH